MYIYLLVSLMSASTHSQVEKKFPEAWDYVSIVHYVVLELSALPGTGSSSITVG